MRFLLDTHAWFWWTMDSPRLPAQARLSIADQDNEVIVSAVSVFELTQKHRLGKLPSMAALAHDVEDHLDRQGFARLSVSITHAALAGRLPHEHRDPFDRLLIAQALVENIPIVSNERFFDELGVRRLWE